jgi:hypothetical protein
MNEVDDEVLHRFSRENITLNAGVSRIVYRDTEFVVFGLSHIFVVWYVQSESTVWADTSPKNRTSPTGSLELLPGIQSSFVSAQISGYPIVVPWREIRPKGRTEIYGSLLIFPSGLRCSSQIKSYSISQIIQH